MLRTYTELITIPTFEERYDYLKQSGKVAEETFAFDRYLNQIFYSSPEWKRVRRDVIVRDNGCDLAIPDRMIMGKIIVHHMNKITLEDIKNRNPDILNPEYLISVSHMTHNAIEYGDDHLLIKEYKERSPNDTCPWRR